MPTTKITVTDHWGRYRHDINNAVEDALGRMGHVVASEAQHQTTRYRIHSILAKMKITGVQRSTRGWIIHVVGTDFREVFFEKGTYRHRRAKLKQPGRRRAGSELRGGVKPGHFMRKGVTAARARLVGILRSELGRIGRV